MAKSLFVFQIIAIFQTYVLTLTEPCLAQDTKTLYDESKNGDLANVTAADDPLMILDQTGVFAVVGRGKDAVDDCDGFVFEVKAGKAFDFTLAGDAAEFKWLKRITEEGSIEQVAFGSTNLRFNSLPSIGKESLPPGKYMVEMYFGPDGATSDWVAKIAPRDNDTPNKSLLNDLSGPSTKEKLKQVSWPGVSTFHGHNWNDDKPYIAAVKHAGFNAVGCTEWQIDDIAKHGLKGFIFIWPHEATTIPAKLKDNKNVLCYYLSDRIEPAKWGYWATLEKQCYRADPKHPAIFTMKGTWGAIEKFPPTVKGRAMEYYHYHWDANRAPHMRYALLEQFRKASAKSGNVPLCRIVETRPEDMNKTRQTIFTSLAYGFRGFRWGGRGLFDVEERDLEGVPKLTEQGKQAKRINAKLVPYLIAMDGCASTAVYHSKPLPAGTNEQPNQQPVKFAGEQIMMGVFEKDKMRLFLIANKDHSKKRSTVLTLADSNQQLLVFSHDINQWLAAEESDFIKLKKGALEIDLPPADCLLLKLK